MVMSAAAMRSKAFFISSPQPEAAMRLICFPWAGGAPWAYRDWCTQLPDIELATACLPGRGTRVHEPPATDMGTLLKAYCDSLADWAQDKPYALFGHSLGALMSFGLAQILQQQGLRLPQHVFVSACTPDPTHRPHPPDDADDGAFLAAMGTSHGLTAEVLSHPELRRLAITTLRCDLQLAATASANTTVLRAPLTAYYGNQDPLTPRAAMQQWGTHTQGRFTLRELPGAHFFLREHRGQLLKDIRRALRVREQTH